MNNSQAIFGIFFSGFSKNIEEAELYINTTGKLSAPFVR